MDDRLPDRTGNHQAERGRARLHNAGPKMTQVSIALDRLLDTVADVAKDRRDEGRKAIQHKGLLLVGETRFIPLLNLSFSPGSAE